MRPKQPGLPKLPKAVTHTAAVVCAVAVAAVGFVVINRPLTEWRHDITRRADLVQAKLSEGPALRRRHAEQQQQLDDLLASVEEVNNRLPDQPREGEFLADLSRLAEANEVSIEDFRRGRTLDADTHSVVTVSVTAEGPHRGACAVVDAVSKLPRLAELTHLEIGPGSTEGVYKMQMTYALYYGMSAPKPAVTAIN
ncbi:MAG: type 4a pilus biogenesis protein PilO [Planctomycetota bacterium]